MITYNQEDYIESSLNSVIFQSVLPIEIIIYDDYSTDNTRSILISYQNKYPEIIKLNFNNVNLGIYENLNVLMRHPIKGDVISFLAGDDLFKPGIFEEFNQILKYSDETIFNKKFLILSNVGALAINGYESVIINNYSLRNRNFIKLKLRNLIGPRMTGISRKLFDNLGDYNLDLGLWADAELSFRMFLNTDKFLFINRIFPIYRIGVGVTSTTKKIEFSNSLVKLMNFYKKEYRKCFDVFDLIYINKMKFKSKLDLDRCAKNLIFFFYFQIMSIFDVLFRYQSLMSYIYEYSAIFNENQKKKIKSTLFTLRIKK